MTRKSLENVFRIAIFALCIITMSNQTKAQFTGGDGTSGNPYLISTATELAQLATYINEGNTIYADSGVHYQLTTDINLTGTWTPIGNETNPFKGVFDGDSNEISNLYIGSEVYAGLFGCTYNSIIKDLGVVNVDITSYGGTARAGGLVGINQGSVLNCYATGTVKKDNNIASSSFSDYAYIGGLVGDNQGSVSNCYASCAIIAVTLVNSGRGNYQTHSSAGGVVGYNQSNGSVSNCYATGSVATSSRTEISVVGDVYSYSYVGGIVGDNFGVISNCYATGDISSTSYAYAPNSTRSIYSYSRAGGVVGHNQNDGTVSNCYAIGAVSSSATSESTDVYGNRSSYNYPYSYAGGIVGDNSSAVSTVSDCAALNPEISCASVSRFGRNNTTYKYYGRVAGSNSGTLATNIAFDDMINPTNTTSWSEIGASDLSGESYTKNKINTNDTLGGRFTTPVWITQAGKLPGLFGNTVDMPAHLYVAPTPPSIITTTLPDAIEGIAYSQTLSADGDTPITWSISSGVLPTGLSLSSSGLISGTPAIVDTFLFTVTATNAAGEDSVALKINVSKANLDGTVTIIGNTVFGATLTADTTGLHSTPTIPAIGALSYHWKRNGAIEIGTNSATYTLVQEDIGSTLTLTVTAANCDGSVTSSSTSTVTKASQTAPSAPTLANKTATSITLNDIPDCEYRMSNVWQALTTFSNLTPNTSYTFYARKPETDTHAASPESQGATFATNSEVGIDEFTRNDLPFTIFPNPTTGELKIESEKLKVNKAELFDIYGKLLAIYDLRLTTKIDISHFPVGIYLLRIDGITIKIAKQ